MNRCVAAVSIAFCLSATAPGVLSVHGDNPRWFADSSGRAIYLGGHQIFVDLQDNSFNKEFIRNNDRLLDWDEYVSFLQEHEFNYLRNWIIWSTGSGTMAPVNRAIAFPMPYQRVKGHGRAADGKDRFDLDSFDEAFFQRMRQRCEDLQKAGVYVSIMLFEVYGFLNGEKVGDPPQSLWDGNVFNRKNNINGIDLDYDGNGNGIEFFYADDERVLRLQRAYVKKVIDTLNHLDNVFYEIANELYAPQWQYEMIEFIQAYEKAKPKQHLVLMSAGGRTATGAWKQMGRDVAVDSPAHCFAAAGSWQSRRFKRKNPPPNNSGKPGIVDTDHGAAGTSDVGYVWSALTRGYHFNLYDKPFENPGAESPTWQRMRKSVGQAVEYAGRLDLADAFPREDLASTKFCLAKPGHQYIVYQPGDGPVTVSGLHVGTSYDFEVFDTVQAKVIDTGRMRASHASASFGSAQKGTVLFVTALSAEELKRHSLIYINTSFENASPLYWEITDAGDINVFLMYDHERSSLNRAAGHWHFMVEAPRGIELTLVLNNLNNIWNGRPASPAKDQTICYVSPDGANWRACETELLEGQRLRLVLQMESERVFVARLVPYRISNLNNLLDRIRDHPKVKITTIGKTLEGRPLEIIRIGNQHAQYSILIRARAHAWETGGNWVIEGMIRRLLEGDQKARAYLDRYSVYIMPMANKDGVARGWTRFNARGKDLNRDWDAPADPAYAPENSALESWLALMIKQGHKPDLMIDFHNDQGGRLHISRPNIDLAAYLARMKRLESLLRSHSWFTEGATGGNYRNPGTIGEGLLERYGIHACVHELNANWIAGLGSYPSDRHWELYGEQLCKVFYELFVND